MSLTIEAGPKPRARYILSLAIGTCMAASCVGERLADDDRKESHDEYGEAQDGFLGATSFNGCDNENDRAYIEDVAKTARVVMRSHAFAQCVQDVWTTGVVLPLGGCNKTLASPGNTQYGPYVPCGSGSMPNSLTQTVCSTYCATDSVVSSEPDGCGCDAIIEATASQQIGRFMSAVSLPNDVVHFCKDTPLPLVECGVMTNGGVGSNESRWSSRSPDRYYRAGLLMHELIHTASYTHKGSGTFDCGFGGTLSGYQAATAVVGGCVSAIANRSDALCDLEHAGCEPYELRIVTDYQTTSTADCECVPDVHRWPTNENESQDQFGKALAVGDFDGDGFDDLAVGTPGELNDSGAVYLFRGSPTGLHHWKRIVQTDLVVVDGYFGTMTLATEFGDRFGYALAAGDFDGDGYDDLSIGIPGEKLSSESHCSNGECGYVVLLPGAASGPQVAGGQGISQRGLGANESNDRFGHALASGDLDGDGRDELIVGVPFEVYSGKRAGAVMVFRGLAAPALPVVPWKLILQSQGQATNDNDDLFGMAMAVGNVFSSDSLPELVIGAPGKNNGSGRIYVAQYNGIGWSLPTYRDHPSAGVTGLGRSVAVGNVIGDAADDVIAGAPKHGSGAGNVVVWEGDAFVLGQATQLHNGDSGQDSYGKAVAVGNFLENTAHDDIVVGIPTESIGSSVEGALWRYYGHFTSMQSAGWSGQGHLFAVSASDAVLPTNITQNARLGLSVAVGRFNGAEEHIAAGAPEHKPGETADAGAVYIFTGLGGDVMRLDQVTIRYGDGWL